MPTSHPNPNLNPWIGLLENRAFAWDWGGLYGCICRIPSTKISNPQQQSGRRETYPPAVEAAERRLYTLGWNDGDGRTRIVARTLVRAKQIT